MNVNYRNSMKKILSSVIMLALVFLKTPLFANDEALSASEYEANENVPLGHASSSATNSTISMSMIGWGLGLAIAIAIVAGVIHQSASSHSSSS